MARQARLAHDREVLGSIPSASNHYQNNLWFYVVWCQHTQIFFNGKKCLKAKKISMVSKALKLGLNSEL